MALQGFKACGGRPSSSHAEVLTILAHKLPGWSGGKKSGGVIGSSSTFTASADAQVEKMFISIQYMYLYFLNIIIIVIIIIILIIIVIINIIVRLQYVVQCGGCPSLIGNTHLLERY
jgi:hypothetical protein